MNNTDFSINDPRLTAYALGELHGEEAAEVEQWLESDLSRRTIVDDIRATAGMLEREFAAESIAELTPQQRTQFVEPAPSGTPGTQGEGVLEDASAKSEDRPQHEIAPHRMKFPRALVWWGGSLAAAACVAVLVLPQVVRVGRRDGQVAQYALGDEFGAKDKQTTLRVPLPEERSPRDLSGLMVFPEDWAKKEQTESPNSAVAVVGQTPILAANVPNTLTLKNSDGAAAVHDLLSLNEISTGSVASAQSGAEPGARPAAPAPSGGAGGVFGGAAGSPAASAAPSAGPGPAAVKLRRAAPAATPVAPAEQPRTPSHPRAGGRIQYPWQSGSPRDPGSATEPPPGLDVDTANFAAEGEMASRSPGDVPASIQVPPPVSEQQIYQFSPDEARAALYKMAAAERHVQDPVVLQRLKLERQLLIQKLRELSTNESYNLITDNPFLKPAEEPLSTFSIDVDTASYSNIRRFLTTNTVPPPDAVRIEELINYFNYDYEAPSGDNAAPFSTNVEINAAPWNPQHRLVRIGLRGKDVPADMRPPTSLVFLIDVSGSMQPAEKLPLVRDGLKLLVEKLNGDDRLAIVTYAGNAGLVMDSVYVNPENMPRILAAIDGLFAGGSTNGAGGIGMAYDVATQHFIKGGVNRVILCTDGDFNVGVSDDSQLVRMIEEKRTTGVFLSVLGFGTGNFKDAKMEQLANHGNGNFAYIDSLDEAKRTLVDRMTGTLVTIAKDVKIQVEFNPAQVAAYRLIGYENRVLAAQDFNDDRKDAGEIGAGHTVTALYEVVPPGVPIDPQNPEAPPVDDLKYQKPAPAPGTAPGPGTGEAAAIAGANPQAALVPSNELLTLKLRYKLPDAAESTKLEVAVRDSGATLDNATTDYRFAAAVAGFGMILRNSPYKGTMTLTQVLDLSGGSIGRDSDGKRAEFMTLVESARAMMPPLPPTQP